MPIVLTARNPTDSVTLGLLPAAARLGEDVVLLTDQPAAHTYPGHPAPPVAVLETQVADPGAVATRVLGLAPRFGPVSALLSNSDHLQAATALAADLLGLPAASWRAAVATKNKRLTRHVLAAAGLDVVAAVEIVPGDDPGVPDVPFPAVLKPREGVASEDVVLLHDPSELAPAVAAVAARRPGAALVLEEHLPGELRTYETLGDGAARHHLGSWRTRLGVGFTETGLDWAPDLPAPVLAHLSAQLDALGVGRGACHTEFVLQGDRARIVEVNHRLIGDLVDVVCAQLLEVDLFAAVLRVHRGEPLPELPDPAALARHARVDYVLATRPGTLLATPADATWTDGTATATHRRMRAPGVAAPWHGSNRDYLSAVWAVGPDRGDVDGAVDRFRAGHAWTVGES